MRAILLFVISALLLVSCGTGKRLEMEPDFKDGAPTLIYKTKADYNNLVPVILSDDKTKIISYPHISDVYYKGQLALPTELNNNYLLDNRGISKNVAFIDITYSDYSKLEKTPSVDSLFNMIVDFDPLISLYNCGNRNHWDDEVKRLNEIIVKRKLKKCKKIL